MEKSKVVNGNMESGSWKRQLADSSAYREDEGKRALDLELARLQRVKFPRGVEQTSRASTAAGRGTQQASAGSPRKRSMSAHVSLAANRATSRGIALTRATGLGRL